MSKCYTPYCAGWTEGVGCLHNPWRRLTAEDLKTLPPETLVRINGQDPKPMGNYLDLYLPGHYPFLLGMQFVWDIEVPFEIPAGLPGEVRDAGDAAAPGH